jgi:hypothetical protein
MPITMPKKGDKVEVRGKRYEVIFVTTPEEYEARPGGKRLAELVRQIPAVASIGLMPRGKYPVPIYGHVLGDGSIRMPVREAN